MYVLLDLEWIETDDRRLTQLSAIRTDDRWNEGDRLELYMNPGKACMKQRGHIAFGGLDAARFAYGISEKQCIAQLEQWLRPDDVILVWAKSNRAYLLALWDRHSVCPRPTVLSCAKSARSAAGSSRMDFEDPYRILARLGETAPQTAHRASDDVEAMRKLFSVLGPRAVGDSEKEPAEPARQPTREIRNREMIGRTEYRYLYLKGSDVFHRRGCKACLRARGPEAILGSVFYETAARAHRPCKLCRPVPLPTDCKTETAQPKEKPAKEFDEGQDEIIKARLLTGRVVEIRLGRILGWCRCAIHKGAVEKGILKQHDCLGKNCPYFARNERSPYWENLAAQQRAKAEKKELVKNAKRQRAEAQSALDALSESWRTYLRDTDSDMYIVQVAKESENCYRIFYVSDNAFADGNRYPSFLDRLKQLHPHTQFRLRHVRDVDGHFVTRGEYFARVKVS